MIESDRINGLRGACMKRHPNILLIVAERIRYDCIGSSQMRISKTPYLDWLAGNGVWFEQAYTPHPNYGLAQMSMLTGSRADSDIHELIARAYGTDKCKKLADSSWSAWLKDQKWLCSWLGKWEVPGCVPADFGYEHITANTMSPPSELAQAAVEWLHANGQQGLPWHLCLNFSDYLPENESNDQSNGIPLSPWPNFADDLQHKPMAQRRLQTRSSVNSNLWSDWSVRARNSVKQAARLDEAAGLLVSQLNQMGLLENTLIIFTAASGSMCGSHRLTGNEYCCYDELMRVPMILHWPGVIPAGLRCTQLVSSLLDLPATLVSLLQEERSDDYHGFDLSCFWDESKTDSYFCRRDGILSSQIGLSYGLYSQRMFRDKRYKYVWNPTDLDELYDLEKDPYELVNRIDDDAAVLDRLKKLMLDEMIRCADPLADVLAQEMEVSDK